MAGEFNAGSVVAKLKLVDDGFSSKLSQAFASTSKFEKGLMAAGAAAVAVGTTIAVLTQQSADYTDKLGKLAQQIGMTTEQLSSYSLAASLSDISTEEFGKSVSLLSRKMVDAASGNEEASKSFAQLGISVKNANGTLKTSDQVLEEIADKFSSSADGAQKTAIAMDLMGRSGASMIPLLNGGAKEMRNVRNEAVQMGLVFSQDAFKAAEVFNDSQTRITQSLIGLRQQLTASVIDLVNQSGAFDAVSSAIQSVTQWWMDLDRSTQELIVKVVAATIAFVAIAGAITAVAVIIPFVVASLGAMAAAAGPIVILVAAFAGLTAAMLILTSAQKESLATAMSQKKALSSVSDTYNELSGKIDLTEDETTKLAQADAELERIARELGKTIDLTNKSLDEKKRIMQEMRQEVRLNIFDNWTNSLADLVDASKGIQNMREWILKAKEAGSTEVNNPFLKQQIENLKAAELRANTLKASLDQLFKKFEEFDRVDNKATLGNLGGGSDRAFDKSVDKGVGEKEGKKEGPSVLDEIDKWNAKVTSFASKITQDLGQIAQNNLTKISNFASTWVDVFSKHLDKAHQAEMEQLQQVENDKLDILRAALDARLALINEEFNARKRALEAELAAEKRAIDAMTQARILEAQMKSVDKEEEIAAVRTIEEDGERQKEDAEREHQERLDAERGMFNERAQIQTKENNIALEQEKKASDQRLVKLEEKQNAEKKDLAKKSAAVQYALSLAGFFVSQRTARVMAQIEYASALMSATTGAIRTYSQTGNAFAAIASGAAMTAMATLAFASTNAVIASTPPPMPPAELFAEQGGLVPGPRHSQGGVRAELEGGEYIMPRGPAMANLGMLDAMREGRENAGGGVTVIMHVGSMDPGGRSVEAIGRELGLSVRAHL